MINADSPSLFAPADAGLPIESWEEHDARPRLPKCTECDRPLRSEESQAAGIGPCSATKRCRSRPERYSIA